MKQTTLILFLFSIIGATTAQAMVSGSGHKALTRYAKPGEVIIAIKKSQLGSLQNASLPSFLGSLSSEDTEKLITVREKNQEVVLFKKKIHTEGSVESFVKQLNQNPAVLWAAPNYVYVGDPRDIESRSKATPKRTTDSPIADQPNDPQFPDQYHHPVMLNDKAWKVTGGSSEVIVAATDDGMDFSHEDLATQFWTNKKEVPANNIDDDNNGYVDDVRGWDFATGNNDPTPNADGDEHGTHVSGIIAAAEGNAKGVVGVAPNVKVMMVQFYNYGDWTSDMIAKAYAYATDNGAKIITTSYNIDGFVDDKVVQDGIQYAYAKGVLHFNSAGNNSQYGPPRGKFNQLILVCSTIADNKSNDVKSDFSNYGPGVDVCAPGGGGDAGILSTVPGNAYTRLSGTSMSTPAAAGVAALIWSLHPDWNQEKVAAQLLATSDNIDAVNPTLKGMLGAGRVNTLRALTEKAAAPKIAKGDYGMVSDDPANPITAANQVTIHLTNIFDPAAMNNKKNWEIRGAGKDGVFGTADDVIVAFDFDKEYQIGTNEFVLVPSAKLAKDKYRVRAMASGLTDPFGTKLDGNGDGTAGDDWTFDFTVTQ